MEVQSFSTSSFERNATIDLGDVVDPPGPGVLGRCTRTGTSCAGSAIGMMGADATKMAGALVWGLGAGVAAVGGVPFGCMLASCGVGICVVSTVVSAGQASQQPGATCLTVTRDVARSFLISLIGPAFLCIGDACPKTPGERRNASSAYRSLETA